MIYFDNAATTKIDKRVVELFSKFEQEYYYHPDNNKIIRNIKGDFEEKLKSLLNIDKDVVVCSSGTQANYVGIIGYAKRFDSKRHFITSAYEHSSVMQAFDAVKSMGHEVEYIDINKDGTVKDINIKNNTVMVCIMGVNNELGTKNDIYSIAKYVKSINKKICFFTDLVQYFGKYGYVETSNIDMFSISAHKMHGPKGVGVLFKSNNLKLVPLYGGNLINGTMSFSNYVMMIKSLKISIDEMDANNKKISSILKYMIEKLMVIKEVSFNCLNDSGIVSITVNINLMSESMVSYFYDNGIIVSSKSACSSRLNVESSSLNAIGVDGNKVIRVSIGKYNSYEDVDIFIDVLSKMIGVYR